MPYASLTTIARDTVPHARDILDYAKQNAHRIHNRTKSEWNKYKNLNGHHVWKSNESSRFRHRLLLLILRVQCSPKRIEPASSHWGHNDHFYACRDFSLFFFALELVFKISCAAARKVTIFVQRSSIHSSVHEKCKFGFLVSPHYIIIWI